MKIPTRGRDFFISVVTGEWLKEFQLLPALRGGGGFGIDVKAGIAELFVGDFKDHDGAIGGQPAFDAVDVHFGTVAAGAVAGIDAELEHHKAAFFEVFTKLVGCFLFFFGGNRQVKAAEYPHKPVGIEGWLFHSCIWG